MKRRMNAIIAFLTLLLSLSLGARADIKVASIINGTATQPVLQSNGTLLEAIDFGDTADTVLDGIPFDGWSPAASGAVYTGMNLTVTVTNGYSGNFSTYTGLGSAPVWRSENYVGNVDGPITTIISGLDAGKAYRIQYMNYDGRNGAHVYSVPVVTLQDSTGASVDVDYNFGGLNDAFGLLTAMVNGATSFTIIMPASVSGKSTQLDGLVIHDVTGGANTPVPADRQGLSSNVYDPLFTPVKVEQVLSWDDSGSSLVDADSVLYRVYLDPNQAKVEAGSGCAFTRDFNAATSFDPAGDLDFDTVYYWKVDTQFKLIGNPDPNTITGAIWSFQTESQNSPARVEAGPSIVTWLAQTETGLVLDKPFLAYPVEGDEMIAWSVIPSNFPEFPDPPVTFEDSTILNPRVFITHTGVYLLKVVGSDGVNPNQTDMIQITVYADACEAAHHNPNVPYVNLAYDFNEDCIEDLTDMSLFAAKWLEHNYAEENIVFDPGTLNEVELLLWLDASDTSTMTIDGANGVSRWNDKAGNGYYMATAGSAGNPTYVSDGLNDKSIVDFGPAYANSASGKWMQLKNTDGADTDLKNIRSVFWVMKGGNFLLGDNDAYHFHRGATEINPDGYIWHSSHASGNIRGGKTYLNSTNVNGTNTRLSATNYSQISLVTTGNVEASRLCCDRGNIRTGGQQIAEILIFNRPLTDPERIIVQNYLKEKWATP